MLTSGMEGEDEPVEQRPAEQPCDDASDDASASDGDGERTDEELKAYIDECIQYLLIGFIEN